MLSGVAERKLKGVRSDYWIFRHRSITGKISDRIKFRGEREAAVADAREIVEGVFGDAAPNVHVQRKRYLNFRAAIAQYVLGRL